MSFFKNIFGAPEDSSTPKKRVWPKWHVDENDKLSPEELLRQKFIYGRVFKVENKDQRRLYGNKDYVYVAAAPDNSYNGDGWRVYTFSYNDGDAAPNEEVSRWNEDSTFVLQKIIDFEKSLAARGLKPIEGTTSNLPHFAASVGYCITTDNRVVKIDGNLPITESMSMPRDVAQKFFVAAGTKAPTSSWDWFYERYVDSMVARFGDTIQTLQENNNYQFVIDRSAATLKNYNSLPVAAAKDASAYASKRDAISNMMRNADFRSSEYITDLQARALYDYATTMTCVVSLLRAGSIIVHNEPDMHTNGEINFQKINLLRLIRNNAHDILEQRLGMLEGERDAICDVMLRDGDPRAGVTPLEVLYTAFPPTPKQPEPPKSPKPPSSGFSGGITETI